MECVGCQNSKNLPFLKIKRESRAITTFRPTKKKKKSLFEVEKFEWQANENEFIVYITISFCALDFQPVVIVGGNEAELLFPAVH
jgi:hypothetical protein